MKTLRLLFLSLLIAACSSDNPAPSPAPSPTPEDFQFQTGLIKDPDRFYGVMHFIPKRKAAPAEFSWEEQGFETPVRNQGNCGSCWAFGGTQTIEMGYRIFQGKSVDFSEQDLVGKLYYGCGGGYFTGKHQVDHGQADEASCKYTASNKKCPSSAVAVGKGTTWGLVGQPNRRPSDEELQSAILSYGAISVTVGANGSFGNYKGGFAKSCPSVGTNHIVALTGWKTNPEDGKVYFKIKNSWGESWGDKGYGYFRAGCWNLAEEASWLAVDKVPCPPPAVKLPAEYILNYDDEVLLAVKNISGVTYSWWNGSVKLGDGPVLEFLAKDSVVITLRAENLCGKGEFITRITVKNPL